MKRFCTACGHELDEGSEFCTNCGTRAIQNIPLETQQFSPTKKQKKIKKPKPKWIRITIPVVISILLLSLLGLGVYKAGEATGLWQKKAINRAFNSWKNQKNFKEEEKALLETIKKMQADLKTNNLGGALVYVHPDEKEKFKTIFINNPDKIPVIVTLMDSPTITYLSTDSGNYEALRVAIVQIGTPTPGASSELPDTGIAVISLVKTEDGWLIDDLS